MNKQLGSFEPLENLLPKLPPILRDRALLCAAERNLPAQLAGLVALGAVSSCLGKGLTVRSGPSRQTRANVYILVGLGSAFGKSEVFRELFGPLMGFETELLNWWDKEAASRARAGEELTKMKITAIRSKVKANSHPGIELFKMLRSAEEKREICKGYLEPPSLLAEDATPQALAKTMASSFESIALLSSDARVLLGRLAKTDSLDETIFNKSFSGDLALTTRISRRSVRMPSPCMTSVLLTQLDAYGNFVAKTSKTGSGLLPRFLHTSITGNSQSPAKIDRRRAPSIRRDYAHLLTGLIESFCFETETEEVEPSKDGYRYMEELESQCRGSAAEDLTIDGEILRRRAEQTWRIALCLHAAHHGAKASAQTMAKETLETAFQIVVATT